MAAMLAAMLALVFADELKEVAAEQTTLKPVGTVQAVPLDDRGVEIAPPKLPDTPEKRLRSFDESKHKEAPVVDATAVSADDPTVRALMNDVKMCPREVRAKRPGKPADTREERL